MSAYLDGLMYGLIFIFSVGPAFFALLQTALRAGFTRAVCVSIGVNTTDAIFIFLILFGFSSILENETVRFWSGLVGALVLVLFGLSAWLKTKQVSVAEGAERKPVYTYLFKGVALNGFNPTIALFWAGVVGSVSALGYTVDQQYSFFAGFITTVLCTDALKAFLITRFSQHITDRALTIVNRIVGTVFIFFGLRLIVYLAGGV